MAVKKNDLVLIIQGTHKGQKGKVIKVFPDGHKAIVEGRNLIKRHKRPSNRDPKGGIVEKEGPIGLDSLMVVCPKCNIPSRMGIKLLDDKRKVRVCKKCGEMIDS
jgi:large subunit ribosomal protein L24